MPLNRWKPTLKGRCISTAVVSAANGRSVDGAEGWVDTAVQISIAQLIVAPAAIVCKT